MPVNVKKRYEDVLMRDPENQKIQLMIQNFDEALSHPSKHDLDDFAINIKNCSISKKI